MYRASAVLCVVSFWLLGGCVPTSLYDWGDYEPALYSYYESPEQLETLMVALETTIKKAEEEKTEAKKPRPVAPGLYAEYGYLLLTRNRQEEAVSYFEKEKATWPESTVLMDKMIAVAKASEERASRKTDTTEGSGPR